MLQRIEGFFVRRFLPDVVTPIDRTSPVEPTTEELATEQNVALVKKLIVELSNGALEAKESSRIAGQPQTGGVVPLEVVVLNRELPGFSERLLTTILVALERKADGSLPEGVMFPVTRKKVQELLTELRPQLKEKQAAIAAEYAKLFKNG